MIKLVASDLDGTLLDGKSALTARTIGAVRKLHERGARFLIASGRSIVSVSAFREALGIPMFLICNNGANIYDEAGALIYKSPMSPALVEKISCFLADRGIDYNGFDENHLYIHSRKQGAIVSLENQYFDLKVMTELDWYPSMTKLLAKADEEIIQNVKRELEREDFAKELDLSISHPRCLDVVDKFATKGRGLRLVAEKLGMEKDEIMAFGDADNDLSMLESAGIPVAMEGSMLAASGRFKRIARPNTDDGVARYLEETFDF